MCRYEEVIRIVESKEVSVESDRVIQRLAEEMEQQDSHYDAILEAAELCVENPEIDNTALGRIKRMSNIFSEDELNEKIGLIIDVVFSKGAVVA